MGELTGSLLSGRRLARNTIWTLIGVTAPLLVGLFTIPLLIERLGTDRFGLLTIIWMGVGYFSLFDMGLGRALTKLVAERLGSEETAELGELMWTALTLILGLGLVGTVLIGLAAAPLVEYVLDVRQTLQPEAIGAFRLMAVGLPAVTLTSALVGVLAAHQRFLLIAAARIPLGVLTFAGPLATAFYTPSLVWATGVLLAARILALLVYFVAGAQVRPELKQPRRPKSMHLRPLFSFGGWLTLTNIVGPLMVYFDRFFIGSIMGMTAVAYYVTPYEVLSRLQLVPESFMSVLFPALSTAIAADRSRLQQLFAQSTRTLFWLMLPPIGAFFLFAPELLQVWLGSDFRTASSPIVRWLAMGLLINTMARPAFTVLQSSGRPDLVARTHLLELGPYLAALWFLTREFGIVGTAIAWFLRILVDTIALNVLARRQFPDLSGEIGRSLMLTTGFVAVLGFLWRLDSLAARGALLLVIIGVSGWYLWPTLMRMFPVRIDRNDQPPDLQEFR